MTLARKPMARGTSEMKRSAPLKSKKPMARGDSQLARNAKPMAAVGARGKRMRQGKVTATAQEQSWMDRAQASGCIVCWMQFGVVAGAEIHHLKGGDRRMGHLFTIPLCYPHHRGGDGEGTFISRHPWKVRFEAAYGFELDLLEEVRLRLSPSSLEKP